MFRFALLGWLLGRFVYVVCFCLFCGLVCLFGYCVLVVFLLLVVLLLLFCDCLVVGCPFCLGLVACGLAMPCWFTFIVCCCLYLLFA